MALVAVACGHQPRGDETATREELGSCALAPDVNARIEPAHSRLTRPMRWVSANSVEPDGASASGAPGRTPVRLRGVASFDAGPGSPMSDQVVTIHPANVPHARLATEARKRFVAGVADDGRLMVLAATGEAGEVAFVGDCQYRLLTEPFDRYVAAKGAGRRPVDVLRSVVATPAGRAELTAFFTSPAPPAWDQLAPDRRQLGESTPAEVRAALRTVALHYDIPAGWRTHGEVGLCSRLAVAWAECTSLTAWAAVQGPVTFRSSFSVGQGIELWALGEPRRLDAPLGRLVTIGAGTVARGFAADRAVVVRPAPGIATFEDFRAAIAAGRDSLVVV